MKQKDEKIEQADKLRKRLNYYTIRKKDVEKVLRKIRQNLSEDIAEVNEKVKKGSYELSQGLKIEDAYYDIGEEFLNLMQKDVEEDFYLAEIIIYLNQEIRYCNEKINEIRSTIINLEARL